MTLIVNEDRKKFQNVMNQSSNSLHNIKILVIYQKRCLTSLHYLAGLLKGKKKSSTKEEFIKMFDEKRLSKSPSMFDKQKLNMDEQPIY